MASLNSGISGTEPEVLGAVGTTVIGEPQMKKIALVGCGRIMERHVEAIAANPGLEIAMVCDKEEQKAKAAAARL